MVWKLLILQVGFFFLLIFLLQRFFHGQLLSGISRMEKLQQKNLRKEEELKQHQDLVMKDCQNRIRKIDEEIRQKKMGLEEELRQIREHAAARLEEEREIALSEVEEKEKSLERRMEREASRQGAFIAMQMIHKTFSPGMLEKLHEQLTEELIELLAKQIKQKIVLNGKPVRVRTAYPFTSAQKDSLKKRINEQIKAGSIDSKESSFHLEEEADQSLVAGFIILFDQLILDGSLKSRFEKYLGLEGQSLNTPIKGLKSGKMEIKGA